jgi:sensor histidine kinase regulating citrate/malate metabolism
MRFQTRVFTLFLVMAILTSLIIAGFMYGPTKQIFMDLMRTNVLSIAATAAAMLDADSHKKIRTRADQDSPAYQKLESQLRRAAFASSRQERFPSRKRPKALAPTR